MSKIISIAASGAVLALTTASFAVPQVLAKNVTFIVDGAVQVVRTTDATVAQFLVNKKISLGEHDEISPSLSDSLHQDKTIEVKYGRKVQLKLDGKEQHRWTTATTVSQALDAFAIPTKLSVISVPTATPIPREGIAVEVQTAKNVTVKSMAGDQQITTTGTVA
ncbi:MAG: ubiquitin-like domain-containing protein, partial [Propionibacteriaceae bacterium]